MFRRFGDYRLFDYIMGETPGGVKKAVVKTSLESLVNRRVRRGGKLHIYLSF